MTTTTTDRLTTTDKHSCRLYIIKYKGSTQAYFFLVQSPVRYETRCCRIFFKFCEFCFSLLLPSHFSYFPTPTALPLLLPSLFSCPPNLSTLPLLLPSYSSCPPTSPAILLLLPSHSSFPPTLKIFLPSFFIVRFCAFPIREGLEGQKK